MSTPVLADRVMRARRESTCPCGKTVRVGDRIARCPGGLWFHLACYIADGGHRHNLERPDQCAGGGE